MNYTLVPSLEGIAVIKVAVEICHDPVVKKEILCMPGPDYDACKSAWGSERKKQWSELVEKKAVVVLKNLGLSTPLQAKVASMINPIGTRMLSWARYHEDVFGLARRKSMIFLNSSLFTSKGTIDRKKAAEALVKDESISTYQRYRLACIYFLREDLEGLWKQIPEESKSLLYKAEGPERVNQPDLIKLWSYYLMGKVNELIGCEITGNENLFWRYAFDKALENGDEVAVRCCWEGFSQRRKAKLIKKAVIKVLNKIKKWGLFESNNIGIPNDHYADILQFLLSEAREDQKTAILKKNIEMTGYPRMLEHLLDWPYQDFFMETTSLMWETLPEKSYADLLLRILSKVENQDEGRSYDYRMLFGELWRQSPEHYKRYVLSDTESIGRLERKVILKEGKEILSSLLKLKDDENIALILKDATPEERANIIYSNDGRRMCCQAIKCGALKSVGLFIWNGLSEEKATQFKKALILSDDGKDVIKDLILNHQLEQADQLLKWSMNTEEDISDFKKNLADEKGGFICTKLILKDEWKQVEIFLNWCFLFKESIICFKEKVAYAENYRVCNRLISNRKWDKANNFLNWCFSSEEKINSFKKNQLLEVSGTDIHFRFIQDNNWKEAKTFFNWLGLSESEVNRLKKETLFKNGAASEMFSELMFSEEGDEEFSVYGNKCETIKLFLRWYLTNKEDVLYFKGHFKKWHSKITEKHKAVFEDFDLAIEKHLNYLDLENEKKGVKRKSEAEDSHSEINLQETKKSKISL